MFYGNCGCIWISFSLLFSLLPELPVWSGQSLACLKNKASEALEWKEGGWRWVSDTRVNSSSLEDPPVFKREGEIYAVSNSYLLHFLASSRFHKWGWKCRKAVLLHIMWKFSMVQCRSGVGDLILKVLWMRRMEVKRSLT